MPEKSNIKKNISKQVKKAKQQRGGGKSHLIVIKCDDRLLINKELIEFWQKTQKIKDNEHKPKDNDYYIDTFLSKQILDVLKLYSNKYKITYLGHYLTLLDINDPFPNYISSLGGQTVDEKSIINIIDITKLNTFAIKKTTQERHSLRDIINYNNIIFPEKLIFQLTLSENDDKLTPSVNDDELTSRLINRDINEKITELIDTKIKTLKDEAQEYESKMKEWRNEQGEIVQKRENNTIAFAKYLINNFNFNKPENEIIGMVRAYFDEMNEIVKKLKLCDESEVHHGGKKHSKREVLGKTLIIYKINGDRKEYVKHKGKLITIKDYKALIKQKVKPKKKST